MMASLCTASLWVLLSLRLAIVDGQAIPPVPVLEPPANQTVPNNIRENVTYSCSVAEGLTLVWEVGNLQFSTATQSSFFERGIFLDGNSTIVFTQQALTEDGREYEIECFAFNINELTNSVSKAVFIRVFGSPGPVENLDVLPSSEDTVLITWGRPSDSLSDVFIEYNVTIDEFQMSTPVTSLRTTNSTSLLFREMGTTCVRHLFTVVASNSAGVSEPVSVNESIPISPDFTNTDSTLSILYINTSSSTAAEILVSFQRATSCSIEFSVDSHSVVVNRGGDEVARVQVRSSNDLLVLTTVLRSLPLNSLLSLHVEACNSLICRTSMTLDLLTTDVQTVSVLFFETFVSINCTFAAESRARGCVVTLVLGMMEDMGDGGGGGEMERFWLERGNGDSFVTQCNTTDNSRTAYQTITVYDWESDGTVGTQSIPVIDNVTDSVQDFPCPTRGQQGDDGLSPGAVVGIVLGVTVLVGPAVGGALALIFIYYIRTRQVKKKSNGAISIEERSLLPRSERENIRGLGVSPLSSLPVSTVIATDKPTETTGTMRSTVSLPVPSLQSSLDCGPVGEINIPSGKKGKIHMHLWSDTLQRCKKTGRTNIQLLPILDEPDSIDSHNM